MTRDQQRARDAAKQAEQASKRGTKDAKRYSSLAHALPVWIRTNGLLATVVFLESKCKDAPEGPEAALVDDLGLQLQSANLRRHDGPLSKSLFDLPYPEYSRWQEEAIHSAAWIKRFSAALIGEPDQSNEARDAEPGGD